MRYAILLAFLLVLQSTLAMPALADPCPSEGGPPRFACPPNLPPNLPPETRCDPAKIEEQIAALPHPPLWFGESTADLPKELSVCAAPDLSSICTAIQPVYDRSEIHGYWSSGALAEFRIKNTSHWSAKKSFVEKFFAQTLADPDIQSLCCGDNPTCRKRFLETKLVISDRGAPGSYEDGSHSVHIRPDFLANIMYSDVIERLILHELGHACDASLIYSNPKTHGNQVTSNAEVEKQNIEKRLGKDFLTCLEARGKQDTSLSTAGLDALAAAEAFAEAIFATHFKKPMHWISCSAYGGYKWATECSFASAQFKARLCPAL